MYSFAEAVYDSMQGELLDPVPGIENEFEEGKVCLQLYGDMLDAYERICFRLGQENEDSDCEMMINSLLDIQKILCLKMYEYGKRFGK